MWRRIMFLLSFSLLLGGCASAPIPATLAALSENPVRYRNQNVEITGLILNNPAPSGDLYRTWNFTIGSHEGERIRVTKAGYNPATIDKAYRLVSEAVKAGQPVTITGTLRVGPYKSLKQGAEIALRSVTYENVTIDTDAGPYTDGFYYPYPYYYYPYYPRSFYWDYWYYPYGWW